MSDPFADAPSVVRFENVDVVFGNRPERALPLIDEGLDRAEIVERTGQVVGVRGATLDVREGELLVLMGLSGSGKSSLIRVVNGLNAATRGRVLVRDGMGDDGEMVCLGEASSRRLRTIRRERVAMVFQQFGLLPWRTVLQNVALGLELSGKPRRRRREEAMVEIERVGLADWADKPLTELSGGMQQRVGLARALATHAPILLMDEPYSALDPLIRGRLQDELCELQREMGRTILFVSHDLDEAMKLGDRIAIMEGGHIVQLGTPHDIALSPATPYVRDFVAKMNPLSVLRARDVMRPPTPGAQVKRSIPPDACLAEIIGVRHENEALAVVEDGDIIGIVTGDDLLAGLNRTAEAGSGDG